MAKPLTDSEAVIWLAERTRVRGMGGSELAANAEADQLIRDLRERTTPPEAGGADRRLAARVLELDAALQDAQREHEAARDALGAFWHPGGSMAEGIAAMRAELKRLSPSPHGQAPSGVPSTDASAS